VIERRPDGKHLGIKYLGGAELRAGLRGACDRNDCARDYDSDQTSHISPRTALPAETLQQTDAWHLKFFSLVALTNVNSDRAAWSSRVRTRDELEHVNKKYLSHHALFMQYALKLS
jgi:hypothetical protein